MSLEIRPSYTKFIENYRIAIVNPPPNKIITPYKIKAMEIFLFKKGIFMRKIDIEWIKYPEKINKKGILI